MRFQRAFLTFLNYFPFFLVSSVPEKTREKRIFFFFSAGSILLIFSLGLNAISWRVTFLTSPLFSYSPLYIYISSSAILYEWAALYSTSSSFSFLSKKIKIMHLGRTCVCVVVGCWRCGLVKKKVLLLSSGGGEIQVFFLRCFFFLSSAPIQPAGPSSSS